MDREMLIEKTRATRFPVNTRPHTKKGPYLTPLLKKFLNKKIDYIDPETNAKIQGKVKDAIMWRLLLNGAQGDNDAIKVILDRLDGKVVQTIVGQGFGDSRIIIVRPNGTQTETPERINADQRIEGSIINGSPLKTLSR